MKHWIGLVLMTYVDSLCEEGTQEKSQITEQREQL